jgi:isoquinoline 1-oxidoreductase alpha subunit
MITLIINGKPQRYDGDPEMPLLWVLRDELNLKGAKFGCGMGLCGACTVHVNGEPTRSCVMPASKAVGKKVMTIEGLSPDGAHPVQVAWEALDVPQCGYCQAGQMMAACALLKKIPNPTDGEIDSAMSGNLCRCGTYVRIRAAVHHAAQLSSGARGNSEGTR